MRRATVGVSAITAVAVGCLVSCAPLAPPPSRSTLGLPIPGAPAPTAAVKERRLVTDDVRVNTCNGETVRLSGELREDTKVKDSKAEQHIKVRLTGIGNFGNEYKFELEMKSKWDTESGTMTVKDRVLLATKGSAPDLRVTATFRSPPLSVELDSECEGG